MSDYTKLRQVLSEFKASLERVEAEVNRLQEAGSPPAATAGEAEAAAATTGAAATSPPQADGPNFIPPFLIPGEPSESIYGGTETDGYPDCCAIGNEFDGYFCTGTLIAPDVVLTARHCAEEASVNRVFLGGRDVAKPEGGLVVNVKETHEHPDPRVDLMLLVLEKPQEKVPPRPIARDGQAKAKEALVVGFGTTNPSGTKGYGKKRKASVPLMTPDCREIDDQARYGCWAGIELVAGHRGLKRDSCKGDSGGPLYVEDDEGNLVLLGVTSRGVRAPGKPCGNGGIYVRADLFRDWIRDKTGADV